MVGAWYVGRASWRRRWRALVFLGIVAGLVGGAVVGALAGARRTSTAYDRLLDASDAPHEVLFVTPGVTGIEAQLQETPSVERYERGVGMIGRRAPQQDWYSINAPLTADMFRTTVLERGRLPHPDRADEVFVSAATARNAGIDIGDEVEFRAYDASQTTALLEDPWTPPAGQDIKVRVVGVARDVSDAQQLQTTKLLFGTPAFAQQFKDAATFSLMAVWLKDGPASGNAFQRDIALYSLTLPDGGVFTGSSAIHQAESADHAAGAVVAGLVIFAVVAGLAGVVVTGQAVRSHLARDGEQRAVLLALGARRVDRAATEFIAVAPLVVLAFGLTLAVAVAASPAFPLGAVRDLEPEPGVRVDALAVVTSLLWLLVLVAIAATVAWLGSGTPAPRARRESRHRIGRLRASGAMVPAAVGMNFALFPSAERRAPQRTALVGVVIAVAGVAGCAAFAASLDDFVATPARFGLDLDLAIEMPLESEAIFDELAANDDVDDLATTASLPIEVEGRSVEAYSFAPVKGTPSPVLGAGRMPRTTSEVAMGPKLLDDLDLEIGDTLRTSTSDGDRDFAIVGTVYSPVPESEAFNGELLMTASALAAYGDNPSVTALIHIDPGADREAVIAALDRRYPYAVSDESFPNAPGEVRNLEQITNLPVILAVFFVLLGAAAIVHASLVTASSRRREIAVLRSLGFTGAQTNNVVVSGALAVAAMALVLGVPLGILAGRVGWNRVTESLFVEPEPVVPLLAIVLVGLGMIVFSGCVALVPARLARRREPGVALRAE